MPVAAAVAAPPPGGRAGPRAAEQQPAGADHAPVLDGHEVGGLAVAAVAVGLERDALLAAEHALAQLERGGDLGVALCRPPDVQRSASVALDVLRQLGFAGWYPPWCTNASLPFES